MHFIDTNKLSHEHIKLAEISTLRVRNETLHILLHNKTLFHVLKTPALPFIVGNTKYTMDEPGFRIKQLEFPLLALPWILETIENGLWKEKCGIYPLNTLQRHATIEREKLRLCFISNFGAPPSKAVTIDNFSHKGRRMDWQEMGFSYQTLKEGGLLARWRDIVEDYDGEVF